MGKFSLVFSMTVVAGFAAACRADVLYDTLTGNISSNHIVTVGSAEYTNAGTSAGTSYCVIPISVPAGGWSISSLQVGILALTDGVATFPLAGQGRLYVFPRTGPIPTAADEPHAGPILPYTFAPASPVPRGVLTVNGLGLDLTPGDYWIGYATMLDLPTLTIRPVFFGPSVAADALPVLPSFRSGTSTQWHPAVGFGDVTSIMTMRLTGTVVPAPAAATTLMLGVLPALASRRRTASR